MIDTLPQRVPDRRPEPEATPVLSTLRRYALPILGATVLAGLGGYLLANSQPRVYQASSSMLSSQGSDIPEINDGLVRAAPLPPGALAQALRSPRVVATIVSELRASTLPPEVIDTLDRSLRSELANGGSSRLTVAAAEGSQPGSVYLLQARANTPESARILADASVTALQRWDAQRAQRRVEQARVSIQQQLAALDDPGQGNLYDDQARAEAKNRLRQDLGVLGALAKGATGTLDVVSEAVAPSAPVSPRPARNALLSALLALLAASGLAVLFDSTRRRTPLDQLPRR